MPVYWITTYRAVRDPDRVAAYAAIGRPALIAAGGRFLAGGEPLAVLEGGPAPRSTLVEFDDVEAAVGAYESDAYQRALQVLGDAADRDIRIMGPLPGPRR